MPIIRTPEARFENLPGYDFTPHYVEVGDDGLRMHYLDEGAGDEVVLCLHGQPSWSYLYRHIIPIVAEKQRVVAPDLIGFGKSDKYTELDDYTFDMHYAAVKRFIEALDLTNITLVCQDWGGILGLPLASVDLADRFARLVIMNTSLATGDLPMGEAFQQWHDMVKKVGRGLDVRRVFEMTIMDDAHKTPEILDAYEAPFPDESYKAGAATFPLLVPSEMDSPGAAKEREARDALGKWDKPALVMFSDMDPITGGAARFFRKLIPTAKDQPEITINGAGHFLQEEGGTEIARHILDFMERT